MEIEPTKGGFRKPVSVTEFIIEHLGVVGEDHPSSMHNAYKQALRGIELPGRRHGRPYKVCTYYSFSRQLQAMVLLGSIARSDRVEISDSKHTEHWEVKPERHYYKLA